MDGSHDKATPLFGGDRCNHILGIDHTSHVDRAVSLRGLSQTGRGEGEESDGDGEHFGGLL